MNNDLRPVITILCVLCIVPVLLGVLLFLMSLPFYFLTKKYWRSIEYWGIVCIILFGGMAALIHFTNIYDFFISFSLEEAQVASPILNSVL
ncbi:MAG: hypothetical protein ACD_62C00445G0002 [uncultured bacterium]|nr:MAG: hypothetical protein ACD_62C00445G0002 [uncultured bacterium]